MCSPNEKLTKMTVWERFKFPSEIVGTSIELWSRPGTEGGALGLFSK